MGILTLTTDFGRRDAYVGAMKGVVLGLAPQTSLVDITHEITPQDVLEAAYVLGGAYPHFPAGAVHLVVVDPGVGTDRRSIVLQTEDHWFIAPDNGVLSAALEGEVIRRIVSIENADYFNEKVSSTFHGRDIFAPVAAAILNGSAAEVFGPVVDDPVTLENWLVDSGDGYVEGSVVHVDHFGSCITQIRRADLEQAGIDKVCRIAVRDVELVGIHNTYSEVSSGSTLALWGSRDTLEIAINGGRAARQLEISRGDSVRVHR